VSFRTQDTSNFYLWQFRAGNASTEPNMLKMHYQVNGYFEADDVPPGVTSSPRRLEQQSDTTPG
jgi:hypothetical protein